MIRRFRLTFSVALAVLFGTLLLGAPAQAYVQSCEQFAAGTQAYGECMVRAEDREAAPIIPPSQREQAPAPAPVVEESSTSVWTLGLAGLVGAGVAIGGALAVSRLGQRQHATAH